MVTRVRCPSSLNITMLTISPSHAAPRLEPAGGETRSRFSFAKWIANTRREGLSISRTTPAM
ncbi:hypothetical protein D3C83_187010 [compost metagenome]